MAARLTMRLGGLIAAAALFLGNPEATRACCFCSYSYGCYGGGYGYGCYSYGYGCYGGGYGYGCYGGYSYGCYGGYSYGCYSYGYGGYGGYGYGCYGGYGYGGAGGYDYTKPKNEGDEKRQVQGPWKDEGDRWTSSLEILVNPGDKTRHYYKRVVLKSNPKKVYFIDPAANKVFGQCDLEGGGYRRCTKESDDPANVKQEDLTPLEPSMPRVPGANDGITIKLPTDLPK
jgi:hypothetical protein